jgi:hypothetical protein
MAGRIVASQSATATCTTVRGPAGELTQHLLGGHGLWCDKVRPKLCHSHTTWQIKPSWSVRPVELNRRPRTASIRPNSLVRARQPVGSDRNENDLGPNQSVGSKSPRLVGRNCRTKVGDKRRNEGGATGQKVALPRGLPPKSEAS